MLYTAQVHDISFGRKKENLRKICKYLSFNFTCFCLLLVETYVLLNSAKNK